MYFYSRKPLHQSGIAHVFMLFAVLVVVATLGAFAHVVNTSNQPSSTQAGATNTLAAKVNQNTEGKGSLLIYSEQGKYAKAVVQPSAANSPQAGGCGKKKAGQVVVTLRKNAAARVNCTPASYDIYFLKQGQKKTELSPNRSVKTSLDANKCFFTHRKGVTRVEPVSSTGKCVNSGDPVEVAMIDKETPIITASFEPQPLVRGKQFTFKAELKLASGESLSKQECDGAFAFGGKIAGLNLSPNPNMAENRRVIRFKHQTKTCQYLIKNSVTSGVPVQEGLETISFSGNRYLEPAQHSFGFKVVNKQ